MLTFFAVVILIGLAAVGLGMWRGWDIVFAVRHFAAAAGLVAHIPEHLAGQTQTFLEYPRIRHVRRFPDRCEFILYPAVGSTVQDWVDKQDALATYLHAAEVVVTPMGVGDHALVVVHYADSIPPKFSIRQFFGGGDGDR